MHAAAIGGSLKPALVEAYEAQFAFPDGPHRQLLTKAPLRSRDGAITGVVTAAVDISDRYEAEQALRKSEQKFRNLFDFASDSIFIIGLDDKILEVNRTACERLGYSRDELLTMSAADVDAPESAGSPPGTPAGAPGPAARPSSRRLRCGATER